MLLWGGISKGMDTSSQPKQTNKQPPSPITRFVYHLESHYHLFYSSLQIKPMPSYRTRRRTGHFCLGQPAPLSPFYLPTEGEVYNAVAFKRQELQAKTNNYDPSATPNHEVFKLVALDVMSLWLEKGNLPVIG